MARTTAQRSRLVGLTQGRCKRNCGLFFYLFFGDARCQLHQCQPIFVAVENCKVSNDPIDHTEAGSRQRELLDELRLPGLGGVVHEDDHPARADDPTLRPYRAARPHEVALAELQACAGTQFDARVVDALTAVLAARQLAEAVWTERAETWSLVPTDGGPDIRTWVNLQPVTGDAVLVGLGTHATSLSPTAAIRSSKVAGVFCRMRSRGATP